MVVYQTGRSADREHPARPGRAAGRRVRHRRQRFARRTRPSGCGSWAWPSRASCCARATAMSASRAAPTMGAEAARGEFLVFLNPDAILQPGCVEALVSGFGGPAGPDRRRGAGAEHRRHRTARRSSRRGHPGHHPAQLQPACTSRFTGLSKFEIHREREPRRTRVVPMPTISGACFALRREDFEALRRLRRGLLPARRGHRPVLARPPGRRRGAVPPQGRGHPPGPHQPAPARCAVEFHKGVGLARYFRKRADGALGACWRLACSRR